LIELEPLFQRAVFHTTVISAGDELSFGIERAGEDAVRRYLGCAVLFAMPDEGVEEAFHSLIDIFAYNTERLQLIPPREVIAHRTPGRIAGSSTRPELQIEE